MIQLQTKTTPSNITTTTQYRRRQRRPLTEWSNYYFMSSCSSQQPAQHQKDQKRIFLWQLHLFVPLLPAAHIETNSAWSVCVISMFFRKNVRKQRQTVTSDGELCFCCERSKIWKCTFPTPFWHLLKKFNCLANHGSWNHELLACCGEN